MLYLESIKVHNGQFLNLPYHESRMRTTSGAKLVKLVVPNEFSVGVVKCRIIYDSQIREVSFSHYTYPSINSLAIIESTNFDYSKKYANRTPIDLLYNQRGHCDEILITQNGFLTDTSFCNIVLESDKGLFTPNTALLCGTKRSKLISEGIISCCDIAINDIANYHSIHLINAMLDLEDDITISTGAVFSSQ